MDVVLLAFFDIVSQIRGFLNDGGPVLLAIAAVIFAMWMLSIERFVYFKRSLPRREQSLLALWARRGEYKSWQSHQIRRALLAQMQEETTRYLSLIKVAVVVCPLFGLLGTVTGMIAVFDVMASAGMGNPRLMASGVSQATIPTMAGMVGALSGLFVAHYLEGVAKQRMRLLDEQMLIEH